MAAFRKALEARYEERIIMVRPDPKSMEFVGFQKQDGVGSWTKCQESFPIPSGILLADYTLIKTFDHFWDAEGEGAVGGVAGGGDACGRMRQIATFASVFIPCSGKIFISQLFL